MESNDELCGSCRQGEGIVPAEHERTGRQVRICEHCFNEMFGAWAFKEKLMKVIDLQIEHHRKEGNDSAWMSTGNRMSSVSPGM